MDRTVRSKLPDAAYLGPVNSWKALGIAIVRQAALDYYETRLKLTNPITATQKTKELHDEAVGFLRSTEVEFYSGLDGPTLLRKLKEGAAI